MAKAFLATVLVALLLMAAPASAETLTNDSVVELTRAGIGPDAIVAKIRTSDSRFDVSTDAMVALKRQNVPDAVIAAMVTATAGVPPAQVADSADPTSPHAGGIYLLQTAPSPRMQILDPTLADDSRSTSAFAWILTYGAAPLKITAILSAPTAAFKSDTRLPTFYFYFNQPGSGLYRNGLGPLRMPGPSPTPALFSLLHFDAVGGHREVLMSQLGMGHDETGGIGKARVNCTFVPVAPGVFKVTPDAPLDPGEYAFVYTPTDTDDGQDAAARYFDFSVPGAATP